jgi:hypothetical protein
VLAHYDPDALRATRVHTVVFPSRLTMMAGRDKSFIAFVSSFYPSCLRSLVGCGAGENRLILRQDMTISPPDSETVKEPAIKERHQHADEVAAFPAWAEEARVEWGEPLIVPEWEDKDDFRLKNGWKVSVYLSLSLLLSLRSNRRIPSDSTAV